jgi:uncharacterized protein YdbL (DUF1318 family)
MPSLFCLTTVSLPSQHAADVDREIAETDALVGEMVAGLLEVLDDCSSRLRRDAADVGAGAARAPGRPSRSSSRRCRPTLKPSCARGSAAV